VKIKSFNYFYQLEKKLIKIMKAKPRGLSKRISNGLLLISIICLLLYPAKSDSSFSELCYLSDGASSQTFTVNEALTVNSPIGTLQVS